MTRIPEQPDVYIVLINYNNGADTIDCLNSLISVTYPNVTIVVIDNASSDRSLDFIITWLNHKSIPYTCRDPRDLSMRSGSELIIIKSEINNGFGSACNSGIELARKHGVPFVLLLNNDTTVEPSFLDQLMMTMQTKDGIGAVGGKIYYASDHKRIWYCGGRIDFLIGMAWHATKDLTAGQETKFITGCMMLLNLSALQVIGGFDESYFLNVEDWDLSYRLLTSGWKLYVNPQAVIYHKISGSIGGTRTFLNQYYFLRNRLLFLATHRSGVARFLLMLVQFIVVLPGWIIIQTMQGNLSGLSALVNAIRDFFLHRLGQYRGESTDDYSARSK